MLNTEVEVVSHFPPHYLLMVPVLITFIRLVRFSWVGVKNRAGFGFHVRPLAPERFSRDFICFIFSLHFIVEGDGNNKLTRWQPGSRFHSDLWCVDTRRRGDVELGPCVNCHGSFDSVAKRVFEAENVNSATISCNIKAGTALALMELALLFRFYHNVSLRFVFLLHLFSVPIRQILWNPHRRMFLSTLMPE